MSTRILLAAVGVALWCASIAVAQTSTTKTVAEAIQWRWPGAQVVIRDGVVERWVAPLPRPTDAAIAQAVTDYTADPLIPVDLQADAEARRKDRLADYAVLLEKFDPTWATMTNAQRKAAVNALAARYIQWRRWVERNSF